MSLDFCLLMLELLRLLLALLSLLSLFTLPAFDFFLAGDRRDGGCTITTDWDEERPATVGMGDVFPLEVIDALLLVDLIEDFLRFCISMVVLFGSLIAHGLETGGYKGTLLFDSNFIFWN